MTLIIDLLKGIEELGNHSAFALAGFFLLITLTLSGLRSRAGHAFPNAA